MGILIYFFISSGGNIIVSVFTLVDFHIFSPPHFFFFPIKIIIAKWLYNVVLTTIINHDDKRENIIHFIIIINLPLVIIL